VKAGLPAEQAAANVAYLKQLLSRKQKQRVDLDKPLPGANGRHD
jgi:Flp pilus assembly protein TadD